MSNKQDLQKALKALADAKKETANDVNKAVDYIHQSRRDKVER